MNEVPSPSARRQPGLRWCGVFGAVLGLVAIAGGRAYAVAPPATPEAPAGPVLSPGQEPVLQTLFAVPTWPAPRSIRVERDTIEVAWADGRALRAQHPGKTTATPPLVATPQLVIIATAGAFDAEARRQLAAHILSAAAPTWHQPAPSQRQGPSAAVGRDQGRALDALLQQARGALRLGERDKAVVVLARAAKLEALTPLQRAKLAHAQRLAGGGDKALEQLRAAVAVLAEQARSDAARRLDWLRALALLAPVQAAQTAGVDLASAASATACGYAEVADALLEGGDRAAAATLTAGVIAAAPACERAHLTRCALAEAEGGAEAVLAAADAGLALLPTSLALLNFKAGALHAAWRNGEAAAIWERIARQEPTYPGVLGMLATASTQGAEVLDDARMEALRRRHAAAPDDIVVRFIKGTMHYYRDEFAEVIEMLDPVRAVVPREPRVHLYTAMAHFHLGHRQEAEDRLAALEAFGHDDPDVYYCRSVVRRDRDFEGSLRDLETFARLSQGRQNTQEKVDKIARELEVMRGGRVPNAFDMLPATTRYGLLGAAAVALLLAIAALWRWRRRRNEA